MDLVVLAVFLVVYLGLFIVGSIANIIVVDQASRLGVAIGWRTHARVGVPVTLGTLAVAAVVSGQVDTALPGRRKWAEAAGRHQA